MSRFRPPEQLAGPLVWLVRNGLYASLRWLRSRVSPAVPRGTSVRFFRSPGHHVFFGYYDLTPFSRDDQLLLAMRVPSEHVYAQGGVEMEVGYFRLDAGPEDFIPLGTTSTWCWQQGCRLQWVPSDDDSQVAGRLARECHPPGPAQLRTARNSTGDDFLPSGRKSGSAARGRHQDGVGNAQPGD